MRIRSGLLDCGVGVGEVCVLLRVWGGWRGCIIEGMLTWPARGTIYMRSLLCYPGDPRLALRSDRVSEWANALPPFLSPTLLTRHRFTTGTHRPIPSHLPHLTFLSNLFTKNIK